MNPFENSEINQRMSGVDGVVDVIISSKANYQIQPISSSVIHPPHQHNKLENLENLHGQHGSPPPPQYLMPPIVTQHNLPSLDLSVQNPINNRFVNKKMSQAEGAEKIRGLDKIRENRQRQRNWLKLQTTDSVSQKNYLNTSIKSSEGREQPIAKQTFRKSRYADVDQLGSFPVQHSVTIGRTLQDSNLTYQLYSHRHSQVPPLTTYVYKEDGQLLNQQSDLLYPKKADSKEVEQNQRLAANFWINQTVKQPTVESLPIALGVEPSRQLEQSILEYSAEQQKRISKVNFVKLGCDSLDISSARSLQNEGSVEETQLYDHSLAVKLTERIQEDSQQIHPETYNQSTNIIKHRNKGHKNAPISQQSSHRLPPMEQESKIMARAITLQLKLRLSYASQGEYPKRLIIVMMDRSLTKVQYPTIPIWIPEYSSTGQVQAQKVLYEPAHTKAFFEECTKYFQSKAEIKHMFLLDGSPIFNLDEIPDDHKYVAVSFRPFLKERRMLSNAGLGASYDQSSGIFKGTSFVSWRNQSVSIDQQQHFDNSIDNMQNSANIFKQRSLHSRRRELAKVAKSYIIQREEKHMHSISKDVIQKRMEAYGKDILKDEKFYADLPEHATKNIVKVFKNNTYLHDGGNGNVQSGTTKAEQFLDSFSFKHGEEDDKISDEHHNMILLKIKKQFNIMDHVQEIHSQTSREIFKEEEEFCFTSRKKQLRKSSKATLQDNSIQKQSDQVDKVKSQIQDSIQPLQKKSTQTQIVGSSDNNLGLSNEGLLVERMSTEQLQLQPHYLDQITAIQQNRILLLSEQGSDQQKLIGTEMPSESNLKGLTKHQSLSKKFEDENLSYNNQDKSPVSPVINNIIVPKSKPPTESARSKRIIDRLDQTMYDFIDQNHPSSKYLRESFAKKSSKKTEGAIKSETPVSSTSNHNQFRNTQGGFNFGSGAQLLSEVQQNALQPPATSTVKLRNSLAITQEVVMETADENLVQESKDEPFLQIQNDSLDLNKTPQPPQLPINDKTNSQPQLNILANILGQPPVNPLSNIAIKNSTKLYDSLLQLEPQQQQQFVSINQKLLSSDSLFDPTQPLMLESALQTTGDSRRSAKGENHTVNSSVVENEINNTKPSDIQNQALPSLAQKLGLLAVPKVVVQNAPEEEKKEAENVQKPAKMPGLLSLLAAHGHSTNHSTPVTHEISKLLTPNTKKSCPPSSSSHMKEDAISKMQESEYEELVAGVDLDPRKTMEIPSVLRRERKAKLARVVGQLLEEQRKKQLVWEKIQKKRHEESTKYAHEMQGSFGLTNKKSLSPQNIQEEHEHHYKYNHTHISKNLAKSLAESQAKYEFTEETVQQEQPPSITHIGRAAFTNIGVPNLANRKSGEYNCLSGEDVSNVLSATNHNDLFNNTPESYKQLLLPNDMAQEQIASQTMYRPNLTSVNSPFIQKFHITEKNKQQHLVTKESLQKLEALAPDFKRQRVIKQHRVPHHRGKDHQQSGSKKASVDASMQMIMRDKAIAEVDEHFHDLAKMNIPKIQMDCAFTRKDLYMIFAKFKALAKISKITFPDIVKEIGVEKSVFIKCLKEEQVDNEEFLEKIFNTIDQLGKGYLEWDEFFQALKLISSRDLRDKIELFFFIVDTDGNGRFSFSEIKDICKLSLSKFEDPEYEKFRDELSDFFASYIFKIMNKNPETDEIPASEFKQAIYEGTNEQRDILAMFCCADAHAQENKKIQEVKEVMSLGIAALAKALRQQRQVNEEINLDRKPNAQADNRHSFMKMGSVLKQGAMRQTSFNMSSFQDVASSLAGYNSQKHQTPAGRVMTPRSGEEAFPEPQPQPKPLIGGLLGKMFGAGLQSKFAPQTPLALVPAEPTPTATNNSQMSSEGLPPFSFRMTPKKNQGTVAAIKVEGLD